ncbi:hypothetical protein [Corynebacterium mayonis]|uniref:hypothetical protein n=1 Tax=Corynebacterium mayonis TaxID=3062461 RepID=UPI00313FEDC4
MNIPEHVLSAFQVEAQVWVPAGPAWDNGVRYGRSVISVASSTAAWSAKVRERLAVEGVRIARPVRSTDGRFVVGGFKASEFADGVVASRVDEVVAAAVAFDAAMASVAAPSIARTDRWAEADRAAWRGADMGNYTAAPLQVAHADLLHSCVFSAMLPPLMTDIAPTAELRPVGYTAALVVVDGLLAKAVDERVLSRWAHIANLPALALRALEYREILDSHQGSNKRSEIARVRSLLMSA